MAATLIRNCVTVDPEGCFHGDILIRDGIIEKVGKFEFDGDAEVIEANENYAFPGFIDAHTHLDLDAGSCVTADDFASGTRAAILGGVTTVVDFATQDKGHSLMEALETWHRKAEGSHCDYGFHMAIAEWNDKTRAEMPLMTREGVTSYKMYMVYAGLKASDGDIYEAMKAAAKEGAIVSVHCENWELLQSRIRELKAQGVTGPAGHPLSRPADVEAEAVARYMRIAKLADAPAYVVHLSTAAGYDEAVRARERGQRVYLESCPQYFVLTDECYKRDHPERFVCSPPLRSGTDGEVLWSALGLGGIDVLATDQCSFNMKDKALGLHDFTKIPNGLGGIYHRAALMYTYGVLRGRLSLERFADAMAAAPARIYGMHDRGLLRPGYKADIVLWDGEWKHTIADDDGIYACDNCAYSGIDITGRADTVLLSGEKIVEGGRMVAAGRGKYVNRQVSCAFEGNDGR